MVFSDFFLEKRFFSRVESNGFLESFLETTVLVFSRVVSDCFLDLFFYKRCFFLVVFSERLVFL